MAIAASDSVDLREIIDSETSEIITCNMLDAINGSVND